MSKAVLVSYQDNGDWAIVLMLLRGQDGLRTLDSAFIVPKTSATFPGYSTNIKAGVISLPTEHMSPSAREAYLKSSVEDYIRRARQSYQVLACASPSIINNWRAASYGDVAVDGKDMLRVLLGSSKSEKVDNALRLLHYLADKHGLLEPAPWEKDAAVRRDLLNQRGSYRPVSTSNASWRERK
jgi:hypothetical protein